MNFLYYFPGRWVPLNAELVTANAYRRLALAAEESGFYGVCLDEHPAPVRPWLEAGGHHCLDPFVGLAAVAGASTKLRLVTYLSILPYHQPFAFTKAATSLDVMSDGRLILGVGVGYLKGEFEALGVDFEQRNERFMETLDVFRRACTGRPVTCKGSSFSADEVVILPAAVQRPHPPIWLGGNSRLTRRRVVEFGQGWMPMPMRRLPKGHHKTPPLETAEDLRELLKEIHDYAEEIGRTDPIEIIISSRMIDTDAPYSSQADQIGEFASLGVTGVAYNGPGSTVGEAEAALREIGDQLINRLAE